MNKFLLFSMPVVAGAMVFGVVRVYRGAAARSPDTLMQSVEAELAKAGGKKRPDYDKILHEVDLAMNLARDLGDVGKQAEILKRRAWIQNSMGRPAQAREDYARLLAEYDPNDRETAVTLSQLEYYAGEFDSARARVEALLEEDPSYLLANRTHGEILIKQADQIVADCEELLQAVMDDGDAERALELTKWIAVRDEEDLHRASMLEEVNSHFAAHSEMERKLYNQLVLSAGTLYDNAYYDFEKALAVYTDLYVLVDLLELLHRSGRTEDAVDFGLANARWYLAFEEARPIQTLALALHEADRSREAAELVNRFSVRKLRDDFLPAWLPIAYAAEDWKSLSISAGTLAGQRITSTELRSLTLFYQGMGMSRTDPKRAYGALEAFATDPLRVDPFPGAYSIAEAARAQSLIANGGARESQAAAPLMASLLARGSAAGPEWLELCDLLKRGRVQADELELALAHTMASLPDRANEFEPMWRHIAQERMDKTRLNIQALRQQAIVGDTGLPPLDVGSYALFVLAESYADEERWVGVHAACKAVLELVPYFPPAVKLYVQACSHLARPSDAIDLLLGQLRFLGGSEQVAARLQAARPNMSNAQFLEFMRLDPHRTGLNAMADAMIERGRADRALAALESRADDLDSEGLFHYGRALAANGREKEALQALGRIPPKDPVYPRAFEALLKTTIATGDREVLDSAISRLTLPEAPVGPVLVPAVDELLVARELDTAQRISTYLDASAETRSGRNLMRLAAIQMAKGDLALAKETLERAYAFQGDGGPELGLVLIAIQEGEPEGVARALAGAELSLSPRAKTDDKTTLDATSQVAMSLLAKRSELAEALRTRVDPATAKDGVDLLLRACADTTLGKQLDASFGALDPEVQRQTALFLHGTEASPRDPRLALGLVLALQHADWRLWLLQELRGRPDEQGELWPSYLTALALLRHGEFDRADELIAAFTERWPNFAPAWGLATELVRALPPTPESLLHFALNGWIASASPEAVRARQSLANARERFAQGDFSGARTELREGLLISSSDAPLLHQFALVACAEGRFGEAMEATKAFLAALPARARDAALPTVLDLYEEALAQRELSLEDWQRFVESLAERYPENSLAVLQLAARDVRLSVPSNPVSGVFRAFQRLDAFRKETRKAPLESLGTGSLARWHEFYLETSPERGEVLLREELEADPRSSDLWAMLGENLLAQGRYAEAREELDRLLSIVTDERALDLWIEIEAERGSSVEDLMRACTMLTSLQGLEQPDDRIRYLQAVANLGDRRRGDQKLGLDILEELWQRNSELSLELSTEVGRSLGVALMRRGEPGDDQKAQAVFTALVDFPLRRDQRRLYGALALVGPAPADTKVQPQRPLPERIPTVAADGSEELDPDELAERERRADAARKGGARKKGGAALDKEDAAALKARLAAMTPEEREAYRSKLEEAKSSGGKEAGAKGDGTALDREAVEAMTPEEREALRAGASGKAPAKGGSKKPDRAAIEAMTPEEREALRGGAGAKPVPKAGAKDIDREAIEAMTPEEREALRGGSGAKPPPAKGGKKPIDKEALQAMTPEQREAYRAKVEASKTKPEPEKKKKGDD